MSLSVSPQEAAAELIRRKRARSNLLDFAKAIDIPGKPATDDDDGWVFQPIETGIADHHLLLMTVMQRVITGDLPRAMFFLPPGSAKSTYGSVVAPAWAMGRDPGMKIILASYGSDLAKRHGRRARQIVKSDVYRALFSTKLSSDTAAADEWALTNESEYVACGILSGITGHRAHGIIIDDPIKGRQEADSDTVRERTWNVYQEDLRTRLLPGGWEMIIQTRWHEDDLAGRILPERYEGESGLIRCRDGRDWYVVCLPAQCERADDPIGRQIGDYLWPEWFSEEHFAPFKRSARTWNALFQQRPQPDEGTFFQRSWFKRFTPADRPEFLHVYGSSDYAVSEAKNDFTEHGVLGVDPDGDIWIMDWWYGQTEADIWIDQLLDLVAAYKPFCWFEEGGVIKRAIKPFLERRQQERSIYCRHEWLPKTADKTICARGFQARASAGKVHVPEGELGDRLIDQWIRFPTASHDDAVDVMSTFCMALDQAHPAVAHTLPARRLPSDRHIDMITRGNPAAYEQHAQREAALAEGALIHQFAEMEGLDDMLEPGEIPRNDGRLIYDVA